MQEQNTGVRIAAASNDLSHVKSEGRRVAPVEDLKTFRSNDNALNQQMGMKRDAKTDLVNPNYKAGNPFNECKRLHSQGVHPKRIAVMMSASGYPKAAIQRAMKQAIPAYKNMTQKQFNKSFNHHIQPSMRTVQAIRSQGRMQNFKQQNGIPKNYDNMQSLSKAHKLQQKEGKSQAKARGKHERTVIGHNKLEGVTANAVKNQTRKPANNNRPQPAVKPDRSAAMARIEATRQQQRSQQPTMRR